MDRDAEFEALIRKKDVRKIAQSVFDKSARVRSGFRCEGELWDYKAGAPGLAPKKDLAWARIAKHVLGFHNNRGGALIFGVDDAYRTVRTRERLDGKLVNDQLRRYLGDQLWVEFHREFIESDQSYIGILLVPPRSAVFLRFLCDSPVDGAGRREFLKDESALRRGDSTVVLNTSDTLRHIRGLSTPKVGQPFAVDEPCFRVLQPEYDQFVHREKLCAAIDVAMQDERTSVVSLLGLGGMGKTALATWATLHAYDRRDYDFIVSVTAKDRELTTMGIQALTPGVTTYESLLSSVLTVLDFDAPSELVAQEKLVKEILSTSRGLIVVDNLETVDDARVVQFLEQLPGKTRGLVTSRRTVVRRAVFPVDVEPMSDLEACELIRSLALRPALAYAAGIGAADCGAINAACGGIALAIKWTLARARNVDEALRNAAELSHSTKANDELLEFSFRRVFEKMNDAERGVLRVLSLFQRPLPTECILVGAHLPEYSLLDANETLIVDGLVHKSFDPDRKDFAFGLPPLVRRFVIQDLSRDATLEAEIRNRLRDWFEARDVASADERLVVRAARQGKESSEHALLDLARAAALRQDPTAEKLFAQALSRNPKSSTVAREYAEYHRHERQNIGEALRLYEQAAANAPKEGRERVLIFREWGMLLRDCGDPQATGLATEKFEIALQADAKDALTIHALAHMRTRDGHYRAVIQLLEPLVQNANLKTRQKSLPLLIEAYGRCGELLKKVEAEEELRKLDRSTLDPVIARHQRKGGRG